MASAISLRIGLFGWIEVRHPPEGRAIYLRAGRSNDNRLEIFELYIPSDDVRLETDDLRLVPLGRVEALINHPQRTQQIHARLDEGTGSFEAARNHFSTTGRVAAEIVGEQLLKKAELKLPRAGAQGPKSEEFYRRVADMYGRLVAEGSRPAAAIAEANAVPVTSVHRWIREARARRFLPPGRAGKTG